MAFTLAVPYATVVTQNISLSMQRSVPKRPKKLNYVEVAAMPLTYITAYEVLVERMEIKKGKEAALSTINGLGGSYSPICWNLVCN